MSEVKRETVTINGALKRGSHATTWITILFTSATKDEGSEGQSRIVQPFKEDRSRLKNFTYFDNVRPTKSILSKSSLSGI